MIITTPANPELRQLRSNPYVWGGVFLVFAGPMNPAPWLVWAVFDGKYSNDGLEALVWIVLFPSTVLALTTLVILWRKHVFSSSNLWVSAFKGFGVGILSGPLGVALSAVSRGTLEWADVPNLYFTGLIFGTVIGIVPYVAVVFGLPCMFTAVAIGYLCSQPVESPSIAPNNTTLPKPPKPL